MVRLNCLIREVAEDTEANNQDILLVDASSAPVEIKMPEPSHLAVVKVCDIERVCHKNSITLDPGNNARFEKYTKSRKVFLETKGAIRMYVCLRREIYRQPDYIWKVIEASNVDGDDA